MSLQGAKLEVEGCSNAPSGGSEIARKGSSCHADWKEMKPLLEANTALSPPSLLFSLSRFATVLHFFYYYFFFYFKVFLIATAPFPHQQWGLGDGAAMGLGSRARWLLLAPHESPRSCCHLGTAASPSATALSPNPGVAQLPLCPQPSRQPHFTPLHIAFF